MVSIKENMNEYLLKLNMKYQPDPDTLTACENERVELRQRQHEACMENSANMVNKATSWILEHKLTNAFSRVSVIEMHAPNKSWVLLESTEELSNQLEKAFSNHIKEKICLGPVSNK